MAAPHREDARAARGDETRRRLVEAGLRVFGARGYDGVSTREIARAAGANQAAILYHFGGKEQLYVAVAEHVAARARGAMAALLDAPRRPRATDDPRAELAAALRAMVHGLLDITGDGAAALFVVREQTHPGAAFGPLYEGYLRPLHEHVTALVARATGRRASAAAAIVDAHAVIGMALGFAVARQTLLRRAGWTTYTPAHADRIAEAVAGLACRALGDGAATRTRRK